MSLRIVIQELGREGVLPFSSFFASNRPFNAPLAGLFTQYLVSCIFLIAVPPGDAYIFLISSELNISDFDAFLNRDSLSVASYATTVVNTLVSFGLLLLYLPSYRMWDWNPPFRAPKTIISVYFLSNLFLVVVPFFPPASRTYEKLPYWVCYFFFAYVVSRYDSFTFLSRTQSAASSSFSLGSHTGIYGVLGFQKGEDIVFSESGLVMKTVSLDTYSAEYQGLW